MSEIKAALISQRSEGKESPFTQEFSLRSFLASAELEPSGSQCLIGPGKGKSRGFLALRATDSTDQKPYQVVLSKATTEAIFKDGTPLKLNDLRVGLAKTQAGEPLWVAFLPGGGERKKVELVY